MVTLVAEAFEGSPSVGDALVPSAGGLASGVAYGSVKLGENTIGTVLAKGVRDDTTNFNNGTNVFGNSGLMTGQAYYIVKLDCA